MIRLIVTPYIYYIMSKKKYVTPVCESVTLGTVTLMATSVFISNDLIDDDAVMSNIQRNLKTDLEDLDW